MKSIIDIRIDQGIKLLKTVVEKKNKKIIVFSNKFSFSLLNL